MLPVPVITLVLAKLIPPVPVKIILLSNNVLPAVTTSCKVGVTNEGELVHSRPVVVALKNCPVVP